MGEFEGSRSYFRSLKTGLLSGYSFKPRSIKEEDRDRIEGGGRNFKRTLTSLQLICLGIGMCHDHHQITLVLQHIVSGLMTNSLVLDVQGRIRFDLDCILL